MTEVCTLKPVLNPQYIINDTIFGAFGYLVMQELYLFVHIFMHIIIMREALLHYYIILCLYVIIYLQIAHP